VIVTSVVAEAEPQLAIPHQVLLEYGYDYLAGPQRVRPRIAARPVSGSRESQGTSLAQSGHLSDAVQNLPKPSRAHRRGTVNTGRRDGRGTGDESSGIGRELTALSLRDAMRFLQRLASHHVCKSITGADDSSARSPVFHPLQNHTLSRH
jgi:hypothetical protein